MKKNILLIAALLTVLQVNGGMSNAAEVASWEDLNTTEDIVIKNNISASGSSTTMIQLTSGQIIDGGGYSITGADGYYFKSPASGSILMKNLGKYSDGSAEANTFSYIDLNGNTLYKTIDASVNSFSQFVYKGDTTTPIAEFSIENSTFANNTGTLFKFQQPKSALSIKDSIFYNNNSTTDVSLINSNNIAMDNLALKNVIMVNNNGKYNINANAQNILIEDSIFYKNSAASGGSILDGAGSLKIKNSYFRENESTSGGGAIHLSSGNNITIERSKFENNTARSDGGAIRFGNGNQIEYIKNSEFNNNKSNSDGGAISTGGGLIKNIENVVFENNSAKYAGGGIWYGIGADYSENGLILIKNTTFKNNEAGAGGGLYLEGDMGAATYIIDSQFINNVVSSDGHGLYYGTPLAGGLHAYGVPLNLINTTFSGNKAVEDDNNYSAGGAITYLAPTDSDYYPFAFNIVDSNFTSNSAGEGGALYVQDGDASIIAAAKDVVFSGNTASLNSDSYNAGSDVYFAADSASVILSLNAADNKKVVFNGTVASYANYDENVTTSIDINKSGITYSTFDGTTETEVNAGTTGEIQFNDRVGDVDNYFSSINLYGGTLSIGQNADNNALTDNPDGFLNDNYFNVKGNSTLNTVNNVIGNFAPKAFVIDDGVTLDYLMDVDLAGEKSDKLAITENNGTLHLSSFNVISDSDTDGLKIKYSDTNVNGEVKNGYKITTSNETYDITAENNNEGSFIVFSKSGDIGGGLPAAIAAEADQYIITNNEDENVTAWTSAVGNTITKDIDINANGYSIYTENGIDGMIVSPDTNVVLRNIKELTGFNNALTNNGGTLSIIDSNIVNNTGDADITNNSGQVIINAATKDINIGGGESENALLSNGGTINLQGSNKITFNGNVTGTNDANMNISTDTDFKGNVSGMNITQSNGIVSVNNLSGAVYELDNGTLNLGKSGSFAPDTFELNNGLVNIQNESVFSPQASVLNGGNINAINSNIGNLNFNALTLQNIINLAVDVDLNKQVMDTISASSMQGDGIIKVNQFNLLSDTNKSNVSIYFANDTIKDYVSTDIKTIDGKIFRYNVAYDNNTGRFNFSGGGNHFGGYNPSVMASPVASLVGGFLTQSQVLQDGFYHMDRYTKYSQSQRMAAENENRYADSTGTAVYTASSLPETSSAMWVKPYATFESVDLKNGTGVSNVAYGMLYGGDTDLIDLGRGYKGVISAFIGYNGSHQSYNGIDMNQQGGTLGVTGTLYKGNFFTGLTVSTGASGGEAFTSYGTDKFSMLTAGIANKTGYNIEVAQGKLIIQPSLFLGYTFANTFDYTNSAGVKIKSDPLNVLQIAPGVKLIGNLANGWQPYLGVDMVWNIMGKTDFTANQTQLPNMSVKPYVQYGAGVQKSWGKRFTAFFQTMLRNGGRTGVILQAGFRWTLGSDKKSASTSKSKKVIKE